MKHITTDDFDGETPVTFEQDERFTFTHENLTRSARTNYRHAFFSADDLAHHLHLARGGHDGGFTLIDGDGNDLPVVY